jgi:hypothetical protein
MQMGISRGQARPVGFDRPSLGTDGGFVSAAEGAKTGTIACFRVAMKIFGFWLLIHEGLTHERRGCSLPHPEIRWD